MTDIDKKLEDNNRTNGQSVREIIEQVMLETTFDNTKELCLWLLTDEDKKEGIPSRISSMLSICTYIFEQHPQTFDYMARLALAAKMARGRKK